MFKLTTQTIDKHSDSILLYHQNINRFSGKILDVELLVDKYSIDILCFCETWLKPNKMNFNVNNFVIASAFNRLSAEGGGSLILCKDFLKYKERQDIISLSIDRVCEVACAEIENLIILCVYRPPASKLLSFIFIMEEILNKLCRNIKEIHVCGDFNVDILTDSSDRNKLLSLFNSFNLNHIFNEPTRVTGTSSTCLDNVFSNRNITQFRLLPGVRSDHLGQVVSIKIINKLPLNKIIKFRPLKNNALNSFKNDVADCIKNNCSFSGVPNKDYDKLFHIIVKSFNKTCPQKNIKINFKSKFNEWATKGIRISRDRMYSLYEEKSFNINPSFHKHVRDYSKIFKRVCLAAKSSLISRRIGNSDNKIKTVWKIINSETGNTKQRDTDLSLKINNKSIANNIEVANAFEDFFSNIPIEVTKSLPSSPLKAEWLLKRSIDRIIPNFSFIHVSPSIVKKAFNKIKVKTTEDLWGISVKVIESIIDTIAPILAKIFNDCVDSGTFPDLMKHSKVIPIFKSGCKNDPSNYRPVSVLPAVSKIFERMVLDQMMSHFDRHRIFHERQFGFTKGKSTTDAGAKLVSNILGAWEGSQDAIGIFCDLSKAFDCVDHNTLILKLKYYGLRGQSLQLVLSYLSSRQQKVGVNGATSSGSLVRVGVPQGSILGPFLFLAYINDLPFMMANSTDMILFADDTSLIFKTDRKSLNVSNLNNSLNVLSDWFATNNLLLNAAKTKCLKFTLQKARSQSDLNVMLDGNKLDFIKETVFLGITLDDKLQWGAHISALSRRLSSAHAAVRRIRQLTDVPTAKLVYHAYFHSIMSYGILLWGAAADVESVFILQKRAVRAVYCMGPRESLRETFKEINILTLPSVYIMENLMFVRKNLHNFSVNSDFHNINTRNKNKLVVPRFRLSKTNAKSFLGNSIRFYNKLPDTITSLPLNKFKNTVKSMLVKKAYYKISDYINDKRAWT